MKILVIKLGALGDVLRVTPVIHSLYDSGHEIDVVTSTVGVEVFKNNPYVRNIFRIGHKRNVMELFFLKKALRKIRYDYIINFESHKKIQSAFKKADGRKYLCYDNMKPARGNVNAMFYAGVRELMPLGTSRYPNELFPTEEDIAYVDSFLRKFGAARKVGIHTGTSKTNRLFRKNLLDVRLWPIDRYIKLIQQLVEKDYSVFLTGTRLEKIINQKVVKAVGHAHVVDTSGKFNIQQLQVMIARMDCFISSDTGPAHIAASVPVRQICLCGPTDANHSAPWKESNLFLVQKNPDDCPPCYDIDEKRKRNCRRNRCMTNIRVEDVMEFI